MDYGDEKKENIEAVGINNVSIRGVYSTGGV